MSELQLVRLGLEDYDAIVEVWRAAGLPIKPGGRDSYEQFASQLDRGCQTVLGAKSGFDLVGVVVVTHDGRKGWINRLAVLPAFQRQGVAAALTTEAENVLHNQGLQIVAALVEGWNEASLAFFEALGYSHHSDIHYLTKRESADV